MECDNCSMGFGWTDLNIEWSKLDVEWIDSNIDLYILTQSLF